VPADGGSWRLTGTIDQTQEAAPYVLAVPVAVTMEGRDTASQTIVRSAAKATGFELTLPARPVRLDVDPEFVLLDWQRAKRADGVDDTDDVGKLAD
jgi:hypothetical protein